MEKQWLSEASRFTYQNQQELC